jgi:hypothetical protein
MAVPSEKQHRLDNPSDARVVMPQSVACQNGNTATIGNLCIQSREIVAIDDQPREIL